MAGVRGVRAGVLLAVAVLVLGGLAVLRAVQGGPAASSWAELHARSIASATPADSTGRPTTAVGAAAASPAARTVVARPGDSMWAIARRLSPGSDPRPVVEALVAANGGDSVQIGQQIIVPAQLLD